MRLFVSVVLILALTGTRADPSPSPEPGPGPEECSRLNSSLSLRDKTPVLGRFHFLIGFTDSVLYRSILNRTSSFWFNVTQNQDQTGLGLDQFNKMNGTCLRTKANATITGDTVKVTLSNMTSEFRFLRLSAASLVLNIRAFAADVRDFVQKLHLDPTRFSPELQAHSFYLISRDSFVSDSDLQLFRTYAQCEGFRGDPDYSHQNQGQNQDLNQD